MVTTRSSGSSFLNRVELQNGCLSRGYSNLDMAIDTYISYVNKSPCGNSHSPVQGMYREILKVFMKGTKAKETLRRDNPSLYEHF